MTVTDTIYKIKYSWPHAPVTAEINTETYDGGEDSAHIPLMVYEDGVLLRGYRHRAYPHPYIKNEDLNPENDEEDIIVPGSGLEKEPGKPNPLPLD